MIQCRYNFLLHLHSTRTVVDVSLSILFWGVWFPFHYQYKTTKRLKYVHLALVVLELCSNSYRITKYATFISGGLGFSPISTPGIFCGPASVNSIFYAFILATDLGLAIIGSLALLLAYGFYKVHFLHILRILFTIHFMYTEQYIIWHHRKKTGNCFWRVIYSCCHNYIYFNFENH